jgi:hypothetical protein
LVSKIWLYGLGGSKLQLECWGVLRFAGVEKGRGVDWSLPMSGPTTGAILYGDKAKGVAFGVRYGLWGRGGRCGRRYVALDVSD